MADSEENIAIGVEGFLQTWLEQIIARLQAQLMRMRRLAPHMGPHSKQIQAKLALSLVPAQIMHILRSYPCMVLRQFVEQIDDLQKDFWCYLASTSTSLNAQQWRLLTLPPSKGGLGLTSAMAIAPIARLTALVQFPKDGDLGEHARRLWEHEAPMLYDQVSSAMKAPIALLVRQSWDHDDPSSVKMLFKKLRAHFSILTAHEFLAAHADDASPMGHVWRSSLQEDQLDSMSMWALTLACMMMRGHGICNGDWALPSKRSSARGLTSMDYHVRSLLMFTICMLLDARIAYSSSGTTSLGTSLLPWQRQQER